MSFYSSAQFDSLGIKTKWREGTLTLTDNTSLSGLIQFNDKLGLIKFKEDENSNEEPFSQTSVREMRFFDEDKSQWRQFALFKIEDEESGWRGELFFEILMEFEKFAILTRIERVNIGLRRRQTYYGITYNEKVGYEQFEKICVATEEGKAEVVLVVNEFERDKLAYASKAKPYLDTKPIKKCLGENQWEEFRTLVKTINSISKTKQNVYRRLSC